MVVCEILGFVKLLFNYSTLGEELHEAKNHLENAPWVSVHTVMVRTMGPLIPTKNWEVSQSLIFQVRKNCSCSSRSHFSRGKLGDEATQAGKTFSMLFICVFLSTPSNSCARDTAMCYPAQKEGAPGVCHSGSMSQGLQGFGWAGGRRNPFHLCCSSHCFELNNSGFGF